MAQPSTLRAAAEPRSMATATPSETAAARNTRASVTRSAAMPSARPIRTAGK